MSNREDKLTQARNRLADLMADREGAILRLTRINERVKEAERLVRRREKAMSIKSTTSVVEKIDTPRIVISTRQEDRPPPGSDEPSIPAFLQRTADNEVAAEIQAQQDEHRKAKARARIDKMKRRQSGESAKMPLTGKAAAEFIRSGG